MNNKIGTLLKQLIKARNEIRAADEIIKHKKEKYTELADKMITALQDAGITMTGDKAVATASIKETKIAKVTDWEQFYRYIHRNKNYSLLQKRVSDVAYRELMEGRKNRNIPGSEIFTKVTLNLRVSTK